MVEGALHEPAPSRTAFGGHAGESIVKAVMEADGVDPSELEVELRQTAAQLRAIRRNQRPLSAPVSGKFD
jgi:hypothetical protein